MVLQKGRGREARRLTSGPGPTVDYFSSSHHRGAWPHLLQDFTPIALACRPGSLSRALAAVPAGGVASELGEKITSVFRTRACLLGNDLMPLGFYKIEFYKFKYQLQHCSKGEDIPWDHVIKGRIILTFNLFQVLDYGHTKEKLCWYLVCWPASSNYSQVVTKAWMNYTMKLKSEQITGKRTWNQNRVLAKKQKERKRQSSGINFITWIHFLFPSKTFSSSEQLRCVLGIWLLILGLGWTFGT